MQFKLWNYGQTTLLKFVLFNLHFLYGEAFLYCPILFGFYRLILKAIPFYPRTISLVSSVILENSNFQMA